MTLASYKTSFGDHSFHRHVECLPFLSPHLWICPSKLALKKDTSEITQKFVRISGGFPTWGSHHLVGGWALPLWKMMDFVSWDDDIPTWVEKTCSKPPTSHQSAKFGHAGFTPFHKFTPISMGDLQDPIDWRYLPYIFGLFFRPKFQWISPQFIWPKIWYVYVPPCIGSWNSHWCN